jgi:glycosyltransferase involved in cell wall biosynthesis
VIAVIVVTQENSLRLFDALRSLGPSLDDSRIVIVAEGSAGIETQFAGLGLAALHPKMVFLGGGRGGARNRGIEFALATLPEIEALCFLGADATPPDWSVVRLQMLLQRHPAIDWFDATDDSDGPARPLAEVLATIGSSGSLVRRRVFDSGLRFNDSVPDAWHDFRLCAIARGFSGWHVACHGQPPGEGSSPPDRRQKWSGDLKWLLAAEHQTAPRFAIWLPDLGVVRLGSSADATGEVLPWADYVGRFWAAMRAPQTHHCGAVFVVTSSLNLQVLESAGVLAWMLFDLEARLLGSDIAAISLRRNADQRLTVVPPASGPDPQAVLAAMAITKLRDHLPGGADSLFTSDAAQAALRISLRQLHLSQRTPYVDPPGEMVGELIKSCHELRRSAFSAESLPAPLASLNLKLRERFGGGVLPPFLDRPGAELAFVLAELEAGLAEQAAVLIAAALRRRGYVVSLVLLGATTLRLSQASEAAFDRVFFLTGGEAPEALNLLSVFDAVLACNAAAIMPLMPRLQQRGVVTGAYLRRFEFSETGRHVGVARVALAFEPALDMVVTGSDDFAVQMHASGVASAKLVSVPDAAGSPPGLARHAGRATDKLNILSIGGDCPAVGDSATIKRVDPAELAEHHDWADILLAPADPGGVNLVLIAAMQAGVVPIAAEAGGIGEVITHGASGYLVDPERFMAEASAHIATLAADRPLLHGMMAQAAAAAGTRNWDDAVGDLDDALRRRVASR